MLDQSAAPHQETEFDSGKGPLSGLRVIEIADFGPAPVAAMMLRDMGADVVRIARAGPPRTSPTWVTFYGRPVVTLDLKQVEDIAEVRNLLRSADVLIEGFRPGVMERVGLGPEVAMACNPAIVYCRATGWGQTGPFAQAPGHDLNYIAITGILAALGREGEPPTVPLNIIGDFAGGSMFVLVGLLAAVIEARQSGQGQVVDAAMSEGASYLASFLHYMRAAGRWVDERGSNLLDGGAPFYNVYACKDGKFMAVGAIEPQFYAELRRRCGLDDPIFDNQHDRALWPAMQQRMAEIFQARTRDEWSALLEGSDACATAVLSWDEAAGHPQNIARAAFAEIDGVRQPSPAPRFSRTPMRARMPYPSHEMDMTSLIARWQIDGKQKEPC